MKKSISIKQILRKQFSLVKHETLFKNNLSSNSYHFYLQNNLQQLTDKIIQKMTKIKILTYIAIPQRQIIAPCLSKQFICSSNLSVQYQTPYFKESQSQMKFTTYNRQIAKKQQFKLGPYSIKVPKYNSLKFNQSKQQSWNPKIKQLSLNSKIKQKQEIVQILLVPLICLQEQSLHRIGYGGGYYDQFIRLSRLSKPNNIISVGIALQKLVFRPNCIQSISKCLQNSQKIWNQWDQQLDYAITEKRILINKNTQSIK